MSVTELLDEWAFAGPQPGKNTTWSVFIPSQSSYMIAVFAVRYRDSYNEGLGDAWRKPTVRLLSRTSRLRGDFSVAVELMVREDAPDLPALLQRVAQALGASILTDELDVNPQSDLEWLMFTPDGLSAIVYADDEEFGAADPAIVLTPKSRALHQAHCPPAGHGATPV